jgi:hypothetical protein
MIAAGAGAAPRNGRSVAEPARLVRRGTRIR